jgi:dipeptidyl aminopeptidase/acylaminoacyl peptidase
VVQTLPDAPLLDNLPSGGVPTGPRGYGWIPTEAATLIWTEALDGGDPRKKVTPRDKVMSLAAPFTASPSELLKTEQRFQGRAFGEKDGLMFFFDFNRDTQKRRMFMTDYRNPSNVKLIADLNVNDRYNDIGQPVTKLLPNGGTVVRQNGDEIFLSGNGASPQGDRPFFRRMNLKTLKVEDIFRSGTEEYESFAGMIDDNGQNFFTRKESVTDPPNLFIRQVCPAGQICTAMAYRPVTDFKDPAPQLRGITKQLVKYKRADGVDLSFTLYLPPGYKQGTRLPTDRLGVSGELHRPIGCGTGHRLDEPIYADRRHFAPISAAPGLRDPRQHLDADRRPAFDEERHLRQADSRCGAGGGR